MARQHDRDRVAVERAADGTRRARPADPGRQAAVRLGCAVGDAGELGEDKPLERGQRAEVDGEIERSPAAGEVLVELPAGALDGADGAQNAGAERAGQRLELAFRVGVERDPADAGGRHGDEQGADRRLDDVVGDVEEALGGGALAQLAVELGGEGHGWTLLSRRRRTPEDAAWRAAASVDPSALAMSA